MTIQTTFYDGNTCTAQARVPGSANEIVALSPNGRTIVVEKNDLSLQSRMLHYFHDIAEKKMLLRRANARWHVA